VVGEWANGRLGCLGLDGDAVLGWDLRALCHTLINMPVWFGSALCKGRVLSWLVICCYHRLLAVEGQTSSDHYLP
jgi:hypothetical protein